jgi:hypothetical protein
MKAVANLKARRAANERGEGVISLAIAVLIMAVIGAALFITFRDTADDAGAKTGVEIGKITSKP